MNRSRHISSCLIAAAAALACGLAAAHPNAAAHAEGPAARTDARTPATARVEVRDAWARVTLPGQTTGGVYMKLTAPSNLRLVAVTTPLATSAEVHEMKMEGEVMRMRELQGGLELPAGHTVELKPGGYHIMLMNLKQPLRKGMRVPLTLRFVDPAGAKSSLELQVPVSDPPRAAGGMMHMR